MEGKSLKEELLLATTVGVLVFCGFGVGRLTAPTPGVETPPVAAVHSPVSQPPAAKETDGGGVTGAFSASKNGSRYYPLGCPSAARINEENRIWFATAGEAEAAGYTPAANCPGY
jgi:deoxyribonuclease-1